MHTFISTHMLHEINMVNKKVGTAVAKAIVKHRYLGSMTRNGAEDPVF